MWPMNFYIKLQQKVLNWHPLTILANIILMLRRQSLEVGIISKKYSQLKYISTTKNVTKPSILHKSTILTLLLANHMPYQYFLHVGWLPSYDAYAFFIDFQNGINIIIQNTLKIRENNEAAVLFTCNNNWSCSRSIT